MVLSKEEERQIRQAFADFNQAVAIRNRMNVRVAKRVTAILRTGMVSFGVITVILLLMLQAFNSRMDGMIVALHTMNNQFSDMSEDMEIMKQTMDTMNGSISYVPVIVTTTMDMQATVTGMRKEVGRMEKNVLNINQDIKSIGVELDQITRHVSSLDLSVRRIGGDVYRISGPMRMFNKFNPAD